MAPAQPCRSPSMVCKTLIAICTKITLTYLGCFAIGTAVYMLMTQSTVSGRFNVSIDNSTPVEVDTYKSFIDSTSAYPVCMIAWSQWGLEDKKHIVNLVTAGPSPAYITPPDGTELNQFMCVMNYSLQTPNYY
jgi:hypothetical protein